MVQYEYKTVTVKGHVVLDIWNMTKKWEEWTDKIINDMTKQGWELYQQNKPSFGPHTLTFRRKIKS